MLRNILETNRLPALFVGSGLSKRYLENMPTWDELLISIAEKIDISDKQYYAIKQKYPDSDPMKMANVADDISERVREKIENGEININQILSQDLIEKIPIATSYFKLMVSNELNDLQIIKNDKITNEINLLKKTMDKVNNIFSTNYDTFFEDFIFEDNKMDVFIKQSDLYLSPSFGIGEMYKIHGCISNPNEMIVTTEDYEKYNLNMNIFISKLYTILLERPVIFLGYSMNDYNIKIILEGFIQHFSEDKFETIKNNLIFVKYEPGVNELINGTATFQLQTKQIRMTEITTDRFDLIYKTILEIKEGISAKEYKRYQNVIFDIIEKHERLGEKVFLADHLDIERIDTNKMILAIQPEYNNNIRGIIGMDATTIIREALYDNDELRFDEIATLWVEKNLSKTHIFPIYYLKKYMKNGLNTGQKFLNNEKNMNKTYEKFIQEAIQLSEDKKNSIKEQFNKYNNKPSKDIKGVVFKTINLLYLLDEISEEELRCFLKKQLKTDKGYINTTEFKRAITFLDMHGMKKNK